MNVLDMTISRVSRISMALSLMLLASWVWFNFLTQPQATNLFVTSPSMFQKISLGNLRLPDNNVLQARGGASIADLPPLPGLEMPGLQIGGLETPALEISGLDTQVRQLDGVEILNNSSVAGELDNESGIQLGNQLDSQIDNQLNSQNAVTNFSNAPVQGGPTPLLPSAQRQNIEIADLPFLVNAPPALAEEGDEEIVIAAPSARLTVNPFAPIYVEEEEPVRQRSTPVVNNAPNNNSPPSNNAARNTNSQRSLGEARAEAPVEETIQPKIEIGTVPTPRPLLPPPSRQSNLPASLATGSLAAKPSLLRAPIRSNYYNPDDVPEPVVIEVPAIVVEAPVIEEVVVEPEPVKLDRSKLTGIRMPMAGAGTTQAAVSQVSSRAYTPNIADTSETASLPSVTQSPASPSLGRSSLATRLPQTAGVRAAVTTPTLQPIGLAQAQLIARRNVPVVEEEPVEVVEEVIVAPEPPQLRPVQIALRIPEPVAPPVVQPVVQPIVQPVPEPVVEEPVVEVVEEPVVVIEEPVIEEAVVEEVVEPVVEEVDVIDIPTSQPFIATVSSTLDVTEPVVESMSESMSGAANTSTSQIAAVASDQSSQQGGAAATDVAGATVVAKYVRDTNLSFTGAILGPVSVAIFQSRMGSFHVPIGETIPDTDIRLTNVKRHEVELRQGSESHIIYLDLGQ